MARVLQGVSGGIAAYKACELTRLLVKAGHDVTPLLTPDAERFVTAETFRALARVESDPGPYPIPPRTRVEGGSDRHAIVVQRGRCRLYELFDAHRAGNGWTASNGAVFDLRSNRRRPAGWTSADAAGLPIMPGLARASEARAGAIRHALRFTVGATQKAYVAPAQHFASADPNPALPPMGLRLRLKAGFDLRPYHGQARVILRALKTYGMIVADNGSSWFVTGAPDPGWRDAQLEELKRVPGSAFEVVRAGPLTRG